MMVKMIGSDRIKQNIDDTYAKGKISELHYNLMNKNILDYEKKSEVQWAPIHNFFLSSLDTK